MDSGACGCYLQWLHHHTRRDWSAVDMDHRGEGVCRDGIKDRAGELDLCRAVLLMSLQDHFFTIRKLSACRLGAVPAVTACHGTCTEGVLHVDSIRSAL